MWDFNLSPGSFWKMITSRLIWNMWLISFLYALQVLFEPKQWDHLVDLFKQEFCKLYGMTLEPLLNIYLQAGLSALKTPYPFPNDLPVIVISLITLIFIHGLQNKIVSRSCHTYFLHTHIDACMHIHVWECACTPVLVPIFCRTNLLNY